MPSTPREEKVWPGADPSTVRQAVVSLYTGPPKDAVAQSKISDRHHPTAVLVSNIGASSRQEAGITAINTTVGLDGPYGIDVPE